MRKVLRTRGSEVRTIAGRVGSTPAVGTCGVKLDQAGCLVATAYEHVFASMVQRNRIYTIGPLTSARFKKTGQACVTTGVRSISNGVLRIRISSKLISTEAWLALFEATWVLPNDVAIRLMIPATNTETASIRGEAERPNECRCSQRGSVVHFDERVKRARAMKV